MEKEKSILLQKQVRNNSEDLQNEFLDMKNWEEQMKKADSEIRNTSGDQIHPPVRKKKKAIEEPPKLQNKPNDVNSECIQSSDYSSWDKFDADKACEAVDKENESDDPGEVPLSREELEKNHAEATEHKVKGNVFVQKQQWAMAIPCYSTAIKIFPYDAVFFANRALCHLKIDNLHSAEADCTAAVQLDACYVKAYHRRATARMQLKQYKEAAEDIKRILKFEPSNKEAQSMLVRVNKFIDNAKMPLITSATRQRAQDPLNEKRMDQKMPNSKKRDAEKSENRKDISVEKKLPYDDSSDEKKVADSEKMIKIELKSGLPEWLPEVQKEVEIVNVITKLPHQRSKKPLRTVPIEAIEFRAKKETAKDVPIQLSEAPTRSDAKPVDALIGLAETQVKPVDVPAAPNTAVQFLLTWRKNKSTAFRHKYLKQIPAERIPRLFQDSMESNTFSEIVKVLRLEFTSRKEPVLDYLSYLSSVKKFGTLTMFMSNEDKQNLERLFDYAKKIEERSDDVIRDLRIKYKM